MSEIKFVPVTKNDQNLKPRIIIIGIGGAGGNAIANMIRDQLDGCEFIVANTDSQALNQANIDNRIQLGQQITQGLGAGADPDIGAKAAQESREEIIEKIKDAHMVFITAGMGGGTGTGAAPVIANIAKELGILTVGVVTKPFNFEGDRRLEIAEQGILELQKSVDTLIIIPNQNLFRVATNHTTFLEAFKMADEVLYSGVRSITDLIMVPGLINLDFADIRSIMSQMGKAMMGSGQAEGENRALEAAEAAIANPLLEDNSMKGARSVLINITGGTDISLFEVDEAAGRIRKEVDSGANIIFGSTCDESMEGILRVSVVATGIGYNGQNHEPDHNDNTETSHDEITDQVIENETNSQKKPEENLENIHSPSFDDQEESIKPPIYFNDRYDEKEEEEEKQHTPAFELNENHLRSHSNALPTNSHQQNFSQDNKATHDFPNAHLTEKMNSAPHQEDHFIKQASAKQKKELYHEAAESKLEKRTIFQKFFSSLRPEPAPTSPRPEPNMDSPQPSLFPKRQQRQDISKKSQVHLGVQETDSQDTQHKQNEFYDIPAFLRRQNK